ncbi:uncharacterized protein EI90DRAFT_3114800 [Cantharellus anzutake]|uniref:uncharacterized protein n=1 Tax=Cantharellus anzutake TaxID=1750568 RepID=UPI001907B41B|nr:uncharacterized protein EI90DRAFT_3114800 [Cantharellus anzutake]KAF8344104.1 hypothetical protein EI90DRAFT_3114800 [Cantharellus anzutake]
MGTQESSPDTGYKSDVAPSVFLAVPKPLKFQPGPAGQLYIKLYHQLVAINPGSYTPDFARSLNNLYPALSDLG